MSRTCPGYCLQLLIAAGSTHNNLRATELPCCYMFTIAELFVFVKDADYLRLHERKPTIDCIKTHTYTPSQLVKKIMCAATKCRLAELVYTLRGCGRLHLCWSM
eukprot:gene1673-4798_t